MKANYNINISVNPEHIDNEEKYFWFIEGKNERGQTYNQGFGWALTISEAFDKAYKYVKENIQDFPANLPEKETMGKQGIFHDYTIVTKIPQDYCVWNIGDGIGSNEYVPFCKDDPKHPNSCSVDINSLIAIKLPTEKVRILQEGANHGLVDIASCDKIIAMPYSNPNMSDTYCKRTNELAPIIKNILTEIYE